MERFRTDLALEAAQSAAGADRDSLPGVRQHTQDREGIRVTQVEITTPEGAELLDKPQGRYVTLELGPVARRESDAFPRSVRALSACLSDLLGLKDGDSALVVGLGNRMVTPDAVGPRVADQILVTRHLLGQDPDRFAPFRCVSAIAAGVLGTTGMESGEVVRAIVERIRPDCVIAVDALAARSVERLCSTVQVCNTGIVPGSGVGNHRTALNRETLGVPVYAIGVPTVVEAETLARDLTGQGANQGLGGLLVTPKDIDVLISDLSKVIGFGVNLALQPGLDISDVELFLS